MIFVICYITVTGGPKTTEYAERFAASFQYFPPDEPYKLYVVGNGGPPAWEVGALFAGMDPVFQPRENVGADIGAYLYIARGLVHNCNDCALLCLGESIYFHRRGWLRRIAEVWAKYGAGFYGFYASNLVRQHLNTTCFVCCPKLLSTWPEKVKERESRILFEHGPLPMWKRVEGLGKPVRLITWSGDYAPSDWRGHANEFWRGNQSECLFYSNHTDRYRDASEATKRRWTQNADSGLK